MELERFLRGLVEARPAGHAVRDWSLHAHETCGLSLGIKDGEIGNSHVPLRLSESRGARYRLVWDDGKVSRGYAERRLVEDDAAGVLEHARAAAYDDPDAAVVRGPATFPDVALYDQDSCELARGGTEPLVARLAAIRERVAEHRFETWSGSFSAHHGRSRVCSSAGLDASSTGTNCSWQLTFNGEIGDGFGARRFEAETAFLARLDRLAAIAELLARPAQPPPAGLCPVLLHPHVVESYVLETLFDNLRGSTVAHGEGRFRREQFGAEQPVMREDLGLRIDPLLPLRSGSYRFTTEGVPAAPCVFVARGRLIQPVLDLKYSRRLGLEPTPLPGGADTTFLEGSPRLTLSTALERARGGALVLAVLGVHTQDSASGDFSLSAPQTLVVGDDGLAGRMRGTISGNLFDVLASDRLEFVDFEGEETPGLLFPCRLDPR